MHNTGKSLSGLDDQTNRNMTGAVPTIVGTGLIALDVVVHEQAPSRPRLHAGGTCGNVLAILSYLGWSAYPVARMNGDLASKTVRQDLERWRVNLDYAGTHPGGSTPVIVQNIRRTASGRTTHSFSWRCPSCNTNLPRYQPINVTSARLLAPCLERAAVFFTDRVSNASLVLARACASYGGLVVFEPTSIGDPGQFDQMLRLAHIVKYSQDRLPTLSSHLDSLPSHQAGIRLVIETLGAGGLRYCIQRTQKQQCMWQMSAAFRLEEVRDTCGAGDWTTAGIIAKLGAQGAERYSQLPDDAFTGALRYGQALGTWNCAFYGARGGMYRTNREEMEKSLKQILGEGAWQCPINDTPGGSADLNEATASFCPHCHRSSESR